MLKAGLHVGLGTDGFAGSNDTTDLFREMHLAAKRKTSGCPLTFA
jgi:cytosine/adenosine deaminase-related metal-dependent hydrolase